MRRDGTKQQLLFAISWYRTELPVDITRRFRIWAATTGLMLVVLVIRRLYSGKPKAQLYSRERRCEAENADVAAIRDGKAEGKVFEQGWQCISILYLILVSGSLAPVPFTNSMSFTTINSVSWLPRVSGTRYMYISRCVSVCNFGLFWNRAQSNKTLEEENEIEGAITPGICAIWPEWLTL